MSEPGSYDVNKINYVKASEYTLQSQNQQSSRHCCLHLWTGGDSVPGMKCKWNVSIQYENLALQQL